ncbi:MAG: S-layer homology domain-containing protein [Betaproteobacteria bacterium]
MRTTVLLVVAALLALSPAAGAFETIPSGHWAAEAVEELHAEGVLIGYPDGTFRGANPATRYELAIALKRLENVVRGLAASGRGAVTNEGTPGTGTLQAEVANLRALVNSLAEELRGSDARLDKEFSDLADTVHALDQTVKADKARVDELEKLVEELKTRLAALDGSTGLKSRLDQLAEENSKLKAELAEQKASIQRMYWLIGAAAVLGIAVK